MHRDMHRQEPSYPSSPPPPPPSGQSPLYQHQDPHNNHQHHHHQHYHHQHHHHQQQQQRQHGPHSPQSSAVPLQKPQFIASFTHRPAFQQPQSPEDSVAHPPNHGPLRMKSGGGGTSHNGATLAHEPGIFSEIEGRERVDSLHSQHHHYPGTGRPHRGNEAACPPSPLWPSSRRDPAHVGQQGPPLREGIDPRLDHLDLQQAAPPHSNHPDYRDLRLPPHSQHPYEQRRSSASAACSPRTALHREYTAAAMVERRGGGGGRAAAAAAAASQDSPPVYYDYDYDNTSGHRRPFAQEPTTSHHRHSLPPPPPPHHPHPSQGGYSDRHLNSTESIPLPDHRGLPPPPHPHADPHAYSSDSRGSATEPVLVGRQRSMDRGSSPTRPSAALRPSSFDDVHSQGHPVRRYTPEGLRHLPADYAQTPDSDHQQHSSPHHQHATPYPSASAAHASSAQLSKPLEASNGGRVGSYGDLMMEDIDDVHPSISEPCGSAERTQFEHERAFRNHSDRLSSSQQTVAQPSHPIPRHLPTGSSSPSERHYSSSYPQQPPPSSLSQQQQQQPPPPPLQQQQQSQQHSSHRSPFYAGQALADRFTVPLPDHPSSIPPRDRAFRSPRLSHPTSIVPYRAPMLSYARPPPTVSGTDEHYTASESRRSRSSLPTHEADIKFSQSERLQSHALKFGTRMPESIDLRAAIEVCETLCKFAIHYGGQQQQPWKHHLGGESGHANASPTSLDEQERANLLAIRSMNMRMLTGFRNGPRLSEHDQADPSASTTDSANASNASNANHSQRRSQDNPKDAASEQPTGPHPTGSSHPGSLPPNNNDPTIHFGLGPPSDDLTHEMAKAASSMFQLAVRIKSWINMTPEERVLDEEINIIRGRRSLVMEDQGYGGVPGQPSVSSWVPVSTSLKSFAERIGPLDGMNPGTSDARDTLDGSGKGYPGNSTNGGAHSSSVAEMDNGRGLSNAQPSSPHVYAGANSLGAVGPSNMSGSSHAQSTGGTSGTATPYQKYKKRAKRMQPPGRCQSCNSSDTPEWRRGPDGARTLCNACGLHYAKLLKRQQLQLRLNREGGASSVPPITFPLRPPQTGSGAEGQGHQSSSQGADESSGPQAASSPSPTPSETPVQWGTHTLDSLDLGEVEHSDGGAPQEPNFAQPSPTRRPSPETTAEDEIDFVQDMQQPEKRPRLIPSSVLSGQAEDLPRLSQVVSVYPAGASLEPIGTDLPLQQQQQQVLSSRLHPQVGDSPTRRDSQSGHSPDAASIAANHQDTCWQTPQLLSSPTIPPASRPSTSDFTRHSTPTATNCANLSNTNSPSTTASGDGAEGFAMGFSPSPEFTPAMADRGSPSLQRRLSLARP